MSNQLRIVVAFLTFFSFSYAYSSNNFSPSTLLAGDIPFVEDINISLSTINSTHFGQNWSATATFSLPMNNLVNPTLSFVNPSVNNMMQFVSGVWLNSTDYQWTFAIQNSTLSVGMSTFVIELGESLEGETQEPNYISNLLYVDTQSPSVLNIQNNTSLINTQTQSFCSSISFSEPMSTAFPIFNFNNALFNVNAAITLNSNNSSWVSNQIFNACFNVNPAAYSGASWIGIGIASAIDEHGNQINAFNNALWITWNTNQPTVSVVPSLNLLTTQNIGDNAISFTLQSNASMNTSTTPSLQFISGSNSISQLQPNLSSSSWINSTTCVLNYNLSDVPFNYAAVGVSVQNFVDLNGNPPSVSVFPNLFFIDTKRPNTTSSSSLHAYINDERVGLNDFFMDINFSEPMLHGQNNFPTIEVRNSSNQPIPGIDFNPGNSYWQNQATFRAFFHLQDFDVYENPISLYIQNAKDLYGNVMLAQTQGSNLFIDTKNPSIVDLEFSVQELTQSTNNVIITVTFDEQMNQTYVPYFQTTGPFGQPNMIVHNTGQGFWMNNFTYQGTYTVNPFDYQGLVHFKPLNARDAQMNLVKDSLIFNAIAVDFISLGTPDFEQNEFTLYPNPISKEGTVKISGNAVKIAEISSVQIFDASGKATDFQYEALENEIIFCVSHFPKGVYTIALQGKNRSYYVSLVVGN